MPVPVVMILRGQTAEIVAALGTNLHRINQAIDNFISVACVRSRRGLSGVAGQGCPVVNDVRYQVHVGGALGGILG